MIKSATFAKHKFFQLGLLLAALIGAGLGALNHFVKAENKIHEAEMDAAARAVKAKQSPVAPAATAPLAPTN